MASFLEIPFISIIEQGEPLQIQVKIQIESFWCFF
uniref:Uncharacterized protein n=1 Tax=Anguilla anguilla TaxID=7936 RepID=A0A0E9VLG2_ANGAN